ncbi:MAG: hypothetical protein GY737_17995 [Desulfobacteraceae bacterium]|nr:hypothetical protein [Desulfobacteraceae bacterium]
MSKNCRNDCVETLDYPKKIWNRAGLSRIGYRVATYSGFREALLRKLDAEPMLSSWTHRRADDPGIALLEGASILGDILTFYQELYANEAYLRTAQWRESIGDLVRLVGYRLSPGLGGKAVFAFEVKGDKSVVIPAGFPVKAQVKGSEKPVDFQIKKQAVAWPNLSRFYLYRPATIPDFTSKMSAFSTDTLGLKQAGIEINKDDRLLLLDTTKGPTDNAQIVVVKEVEEQFERTVIKIEGAWNKGQGLGNIKAFKLGRSFRHFGHNGPLQVVDKNDPTSKMISVKFDRKLHGKTETASTEKWSVQPPIQSTEIPLDSEVDDFVVGSRVVIQGLKSADGQAYKNFKNLIFFLLYATGFGLKNVFGGTMVREVKSARSGTITWGAMNGSSTIIELSGEMDDWGILVKPVKRIHDTLVTNIRNLVIHETLGKSAVTLTNVRRADSSADGKTLYFYGDAGDYKQLDKRKLAFVKKDGTSMETTVVTVAAGLSDPKKKKLRPVTLKSPLKAGFALADFPLEKPGVTVHGNLAEGGQGWKEKDAVLGNGDSRRTFQTFKLPKSPLTYHLSSGETPPEVPELKVYVNDRLWKRVASFFGRGSGEEIYIVREDAKGESWVQFGDGKTGARLPSGIKNVAAKYRTGTGAYGALKDGTTVQPGGKLDRLKKIRLPGGASGGSKPETGDNAKEAAPGKIQSLGRLVGLKDFESETLAISGVSKAMAAWELVDNVPSVVLTVLMETGRADELKTVRKNLNDYNSSRGPRRFPIDVQPGKRLYVYMDVVYGLHPSFLEGKVEKAIRQALGGAGDDGSNTNASSGVSESGSSGLFGIHQRGFGQNEYATRIAGTIQNVKGVMWAKIIALGSLEGGSDKPSRLVAPKEPKPLNPVISCGDSYILSLFKDHLQISASKGQST